MKKVCVNFTEDLLKFCNFQNILEMFDNFMKFRLSVENNFNKFWQIKMNTYRNTYLQEKQQLLSYQSHNSLHG